MIYYYEIAGFQGKYEITVRGDVYSRERVVGGKRRKKRRLKVMDNGNGVKYVQLYDGGSRVSKTIKSLLRETFKTQ